MARAYRSSVGGITRGRLVGATTVAATSRQPLEQHPRNRFETMSEVVLDATLVAPRLGLSPQRFMALWRRGIIRHSFERGIGEDAGRCRVTLRYLAARAEFILSSDGTILSR